MHFWKTPFLSKNTFSKRPTKLTLISTQTKKKYQKKKKNPSQELPPN